MFNWVAGALSDPQKTQVFSVGQEAFLVSEQITTSSTSFKNSFWLHRQQYSAECRRGLAMRFLSVYPSVRLSVCLLNACIVTKGRKMCPDFYTMRKNIQSSFMRRRTVGGGRPLQSKILGQPAPVGAKSPILSQ